ncbi:Dam family site-specific DNA-(adenine-N6)-methyltransferase [Aneurinibacillus sp. Ricciae_BoGa-3]|uniref:Dam family site-specific DNA-(adenine-N6)-methyltransferase n=1 Tax=Aneurinibacillus sp. Ricciae_BoGa-3 TaxID=3022697 RepID=UPI0023419DC6|nr:Dam family site-specific DNA-(adenine-N6)-methyltransferase [Aneurinibacillus sp. Ricciae_BoGa-3]WCK52828.1 Dam family site-specific DNA-(adenine-N6)-methyltransferase [Aneurinibacillus sp. Ricciae_BoGa-3]
MKPFLKWAGGKYRLVPSIKNLLPAGKRLIEPFVGSGALFLNTQYEEYLLCDANKDLITLYQTLQQEGHSFIDYCRSFFTDENNVPERFYELRNLFNMTKDLRLKSAIFLYLNRHGYNGLCRYNNKGLFNAPFGRYKKPYFPLRELRHFYEKSWSARFYIADFQDSMRQAIPGDVIYCDPPYVPLSSTANFTSYQSRGFNQQQQMLLATLAKELAQRGIPVLISNHETEFTVKAYTPAQLAYLEVQRNISCNSKNRTKAKEILALF